MITCVEANGGLPQGPGSPGLTRSATLGGDSSAENPGVDKARLRDFAAGMTDIRAMETLVLKLWREEISMMLPDMSGDGEAADAAAVAMPEGESFVSFL